METLTIGRLAERAEVNPETIRYYEREGILDIPGRLSSGYRIFSEDTVRRVRFVKRAQKLGFSLREIRELLSLRQERTGDEVARVKHAATQKIAEINQKIEALTAMRMVLRQLEEECPGSGPLSECPILGCLQGDEPKAHLAKKRTAGKSTTIAQIKAEKAQCRKQQRRKQ